MRKVASGWRLLCCVGVCVAPVWSGPVSNHLGGLHRDNYMVLFVCLFVRRPYRFHLPSRSMASPTHAAKQGGLSLSSYILSSLSSISEHHCARALPPHPRLLLLLVRPRLRSQHRVVTGVPTLAGGATAGQQRLCSVETQKTRIFTASFKCEQSFGSPPFLAPFGTIEIRTLGLAGCTNPSVE